MAYNFFTISMHLLYARYQRLLPEKLSSWLQIISRILEDRKTKQEYRNHIKPKQLFEGHPVPVMVSLREAISLEFSLLHVLPLVPRVYSPPISGSFIVRRCLVLSCTQGPRRPAECLPVALHTSSQACLPQGWQWYRRGWALVGWKDYDPSSGIVPTALGSSVYRTVTSCRGLCSGIWHHLRKESEDSCWGQKSWHKALIDWVSEMSWWVSSQVLNRRRN